MTRYALLVGIDCYPGFPECNQLASCVRDARRVAEVLQGDFGFPSQNVELLLNEEATRQGMLDALGGLARRVGSGDVVVFYYSGHGSEARDQPGERFNLEVDEPVEWEQTLVPHDSGREKRLPYRDIRDDELYRWIRHVNDTTPYVTVILDSCHAGTAVRSWVRTKQVPREEDPDRHRAPDFKPFELGDSRLRSSGVPAGKRWRDFGPSGWLPLDQRYTLLAACHHTESAKEYAVPELGGLKHGAFTWHLVRELERIPPRATYRELIDAVRSGVHAVYPTQTPQVEGARDRQVFGTERAAPRPLLAGSRVPGIGDQENLVLPVAIEPGTPETPAGAKGERLRKRIAELESGIAASKLLQTVASQEEAQVIVRAVLDSEGAPDTPRWFLETADGSLLRKPHPVFEPCSVRRVVDNLETRARFLRVERLVDREPANPLRGAVEVTLLRWVPAGGDAEGEDGCWSPAEPKGADGEVVFREGERVGLELVHRYKHPLYLHVLDLGLTGAVTPLHPVAGASEAQERDRPVRVGTRPGDELTLTIPDELPYPQGRERIRVFATTFPADLSVWKQDRYRDAGTASAFERRFEAAWRGGTFREAPVDEAPEGKHWTAVTVSFLVHRAQD